MTRPSCEQCRGLMFLSPILPFHLFSMPCYSLCLSVVYSLRFFVSLSHQESLPLLTPSLLPFLPPSLPPSLPHRVAPLTSSHLTHFTSIVHPQQSAVLTTGGVQVELSTDGTPSKYITATLSCDARVLDYELASQWLDEFRSSLEDPSGHGLL